MMWKVYIINADGSEKLIYNERWMPTVDNMSLVSKVRGKKYKVVNPQGEDKTQYFPYGIET